MILSGDYAILPVIPPMELHLGGAYGIGSPDRRARTKSLYGDYESLAPQPTLIPVFINGELVARPVKMMLNGILVDI